MALLLLAVVLSAGFLLGQRAAYSGMGLNPERYRALQSGLAEARKTIDTLRGDLEVERTRHAVDLQALELVRKDIAGQKEKIASLEEGIRFYRGLMAPGEIAEGLSLRSPELILLEKPSTYAFRIVAQQEAARHKLMKGEFRAQVFGELESEPVSYSLAELSDDFEGDAISLRFRYFQAIEGRLTLPEGFDPRGISVVATTTAPEPSEVSESFDWQVQERFTHVGE